jgi:integrase
MHDLIVLPAADAGSLTTSEISSTMAYAEAEKAASTRAAYATDWKDFSIWCHARAATPLPAHVGIVGAYLSHLADSGLKSSTIGRRGAAIADRHKAAGLEPPTASEAVKAVMRGIRRVIGTAVDAKAPATDGIILAMLAAIPADTLIGKRDAAMIAIGFAGALRRSELCALEVRDVTWTADGIKLLIRKSKGERDGRGQTIGIPRGARIRPVLLLEQWLATAEIGDGRIFRSVALGGKLGEALTDDCMARRLKRIAKAAGLDRRIYSGHSLRSGFLTSAAEAGASIWKMMDVSRHKSMDTLRGYVRDADLFRDSAGAKFL